MFSFRWFLSVVFVSFILAYLFDGILLTIMAIMGGVLIAMWEYRMEEEKMDLDMCWKTKTSKEEDVFVMAHSKGNGGANTTRAFYGGHHSRDAEIDRLRQENERFRNALIEITGLDDFGCEAADTARAALGALQGETND